VVRITTLVIQSVRSASRYLTDCECKEPPCVCKPEDRGITCDHINRYGENMCGKEGSLRDDCNYLWSAKRVLCDGHYEEHRDTVKIKCRVCGSPRSECCC
jgi:hypothetical protein